MTGRHNVTPTRGSRTRTRLVLPILIEQALSDAMSETTYVARRCSLRRCLARGMNAMAEIETNHHSVTEWQIRAKDTTRHGCICPTLPELLGRTPAASMLSSKASNTRMQGVSRR
jgi:hypothetical protein